MDDITVVGGGIGGLACAVALTKAGRSVRVLERRDALVDAGTALGMWPNALRALDALGLGDKVRQIGFVQRKRCSGGRTVVVLPEFGHGNPLS